MSAFMVSKTHIRALVSAALQLDRYDQLPAPDWCALAERHPAAFAHVVTKNQHGNPVPASHAFGRGWRHVCADELGRALWLANADSIAARYPGEGEGGTRYPDMWPEGGFAAVLGYRHARVDRPVVEVLKAVHCFAYQASEVHGWGESWAKRFCDELEAILIRALPGYDGAPWGFDDPEDEGGEVVSLLSLRGSR